MKVIGIQTSSKKGRGEKYLITAFDYWAENKKSDIEILDMSSALSELGILASVPPVGANPKTFRICKDIL